MYWSVIEKAKVEENSGCNLSLPPDEISTTLAKKLTHKRSHRLKSRDVHIDSGQETSHANIFVSRFSRKPHVRTASVVAERNLDDVPEYV